MPTRQFFLRIHQTRPGDRFLLFCEGRLLARGDDYFWGRHEIVGLIDEESDVHLIEEGDQALLAMNTPPGTAQRLNAENRSLRGLLLETGERALLQAGKANQVLDWYLTHRYCGACGAPTVPHAVQRALLCPDCQRHYFPRINPCVIVLVVRGREVLLARHSRYKGQFFSCLAGFIEVGENAEETIHRETREEVGVEVDNIRYIKSQSWPFPSQLMLGFWADYRSGEITPDNEEIEEARWFDIDELPERPNAAISVAGELIEGYSRHVREGRGAD